MPPKRKTRPVPARAATPMEDALPAPNHAAGGDAGLHTLPDSFHAAVDQLVDLVHGAVDDNVTMFKLEMANVSAGERPADVVDALSAKARQNICVIAPLCEVRSADLPANGCSMLFDQRQYAEALLHAARAHFAFVEFDRRLIYTSTAGLRDPQAAAQLLYVFSYLKTAAGRAEPTADRTTATTLGRREATNRRRTMAVVSQPVSDDVPESSIGEELEKYRDELDRVEQSLLEASQSLDDDLRLPDTLFDTGLEEVPTPRLGAALHAVLPRVQGRAATRAPPQRAAPRGAPRGAVGPPPTRPPPAAAPARATAPAAPARAPPAAGRRAPPQRKRPRSVSPELTTMDTGGYSPAPSSRPEPQPQPAAGSPSKARQSAGPLPPTEADQLVAFFQRLNGGQTEQSRVSLTCRYAKMRYGHDVPSGAVYRLVEAAQRQGAPPAPAAPPPLTDEGRRETALAVFAELDPGQSEQSRVAYTLQYMRVQHKARVEANTLFGWLGQGSKKPGAKKAKTR